MSEALSFWLDNKMVSGLIVAKIGDQSLVDYRGKFYVIRNGAAIMKGSKPQHFSKTSMPINWKKALRGETPQMDTIDPDEGTLPIASGTKRVRVKKEKEHEVSAMPEQIEASAVTSPSPSVFSETKPTKQPAKKLEMKPSPQTSIPAQCPYCNQKHELAMERGKNGKPFFVTCTKCAADFAVRFIPVTVYQAQVAGFK